MIYLVIGSRLFYTPSLLVKFAFRTKDNRRNNHNLNTMFTKLRLTMLSAAFILISVAVQAQEVKGVVKDANGSPLTGASVIVEGTAYGERLYRSGSPVFYDRYEEH